MELELRTRLEHMSSHLLPNVVLVLCESLLIISYVFLLTIALYETQLITEGHSKKSDPDERLLITTFGILIVSNKHVFVIMCLWYIQVIIKIEF